MPKRVWSYSAGRRGINYVTVYERPRGAQIYISYVDDRGRQDKALAQVIGNPVTDRELAKRIADELAKAQERKINARAGEAMFGFNPDRTLGELLERLHDVRGPEWSESYTRDQKRFRRFWEDKLGTDTRLMDLSPARVEDIVRREREARDWSDRTVQSYLRYIVDASYFAQKKLKWLDERHNLSAVDIPSPDTKSKAYSEAELRRLLPALRDVDLRAGGVGEIAYATGRRLNAIRTLPESAVEDVSGVPVLRFPAATDKARRSGTAALTDHAKAVVDRLRKMPAVRTTGLLFPSGDLDSKERGRGPIRKGDLIDMLHAAEKSADPPVPHVKGRAYHGIKRRVASIVQDRRALAKQSGTTEATLRKVYEQDDLAPKKRLAELLASRREEQ